MSRFQSGPRRVAAAAVLAAAGLGTGYMWGGGAHLGAESRPAPTAPAVAVENANSLSQAFRQASERAMPAVVTIQHSHEMKAGKPRGDENARRNGGRGQRELPPQMRDLDPLLKRFFEDMPGLDESLGQGRGMQSRPSASSGSGVIIDRSGLILTNNHVVAGGGSVKVKLTDGREYEATTVKTDPSTDLAIVRIKADGDLPVAPLGNSDDVRVGDWVLALGQPFGLANTVTAGIISAMGRGIGITDHEEFLQTDAAINPGNSGGPLVNLNGEVVGINTAISSTSGGYQGVGFAVPVNVAKWVSAQLDKDGTVHRAYLGVGIQPVTQEIASQLGMAMPHGTLVTDVRSGSPAEKAGVQVGDVITDYAGMAVNDPRQLSAAVARSSLESKQALKIIRDGKMVTLNVAMQEMPENFRGQKSSSAETSQESPGLSVEGFGMEVAPLTADKARQLGVKSKDGVLVTSVDDDTPAARAGLQAGMVVERVGQTAVRSPEELQAAVKHGSVERGVMLLVRTAEGSRFVVVKQ